MKKLKSIAAIVLCTVIILTSTAVQAMAQDGQLPKHKEALEGVLAYILEKNENLGCRAGEWNALALSRGGYAVPKNYYGVYKKSAASSLLTSTSWQSTDFSKVMIALSTLGYDVTNIDNFNLLQKFSDYSLFSNQGINGIMYGLIALNTKNHLIYKDESLTDENQNSRTKMINGILDMEHKKGTTEAGGIKYFGSLDPDMTAMAIEALAPYYKKDNELLKSEYTNVDDYTALKTSVEGFVDRAIGVLSTLQNSDGGFASWGTVNAESIAQVITALTSLGIDPTVDDRFIKNGKDLIDALLTFKSGDGGFKHTTSGQANGMATEQSAYALVSYDRLINGKNALYDMTDVDIIKNPDLSNLSITRQSETKAYIKFSIDKAGTLYYGTSTVSGEEITLDESSDCVIYAAGQNSFEINVSKDETYIKYFAADDYDNECKSQIQVQKLEKYAPPFSPPTNIPIPPAPKPEPTPMPTPEGDVVEIDKETNITINKDNDGNIGFVNKDGDKIINAVVNVNGKTYLANAEGKQVKEDIYTIEGKKYFANENGLVVKSKFVTLDNKKTYYFDKNGVSLSGKRSIKGERYYFSDKGEMAKSKFITVSNKTSYYDKNGKMLTGLKTIKGTKYYFGDKGEMAKSKFITVSNKTSYYDKNGKMLTGLKTIKGTKYYFNKAGIMEKNKKIEVEGKAYYLDKSGKVLKNKTIMINEKKYVADKNGVLRRK